MPRGDCFRRSGKLALTLEINGIHAPGRLGALSPCIRHRLRALIRGIVSHAAVRPRALAGLATGRRQTRRCRS
jgi:hypothetical protein